MNVLIIGASGLVGSNIYTVFEMENDQGILLGTHLNFPLSNTKYFNPLSNDLPDYIQIQKWDIIIHTGAFTNVDKCELEPDLSYKLTVLSVKSIIKLAVKNKAKLIYISTDYVFDGKNGPYIEASKTAPINVYGQHKLDAENLIKEFNNFLIVRITNVYGNEVRNKNFLARIISSLNDHDQISVSAAVDQFATPINAIDIGRAIFLLMSDNKQGIYHLASTDFLSRVQLLRRLQIYYPDRINIRAVTTASSDQSALRPLRGGLIAAKFLSEYPEFIFSNIDDFLKKYDK